MRFSTEPSSEVPIYRLSVRAHMSDFGSEEERLQKWLIQNRIDMDSDEIYGDIIHASTSFRLFPSKKIARKTIDDKIFSYLKKTQENDKSNASIIKSIDYETGKFQTEPAPLEPPYDCAFIIGNKKYRWPKDFPLKELKKIKGKNLCLVGMILPKIYRTHSDGTTIVSTETDVPYLEDIFDPESGFLSSIIKTRSPYYNNHFIYACDSCEQDALTNFKNDIKEKIKNYDGRGLDIKPKPNFRGESIDYSPNLENLVIKVASKENIFYSWDFMHNW